MKHKALNQLLCAATINGRFRETLLRNPALAVSTGYHDHAFALTSEERDLVIGIKAQRLEDFAAQVYHWISGNGNEHNGNVETVHAPQYDSLTAADHFVDLYRTPVPVRV